MTVVSTTLYDAAVGLAGILHTAAANAGYVLPTCVTPMEPGWDCERIHVWPQQINTTQVKCNAAPIITLRWGVAACIGADENEDCDWWSDGRTEKALTIAWAVYAGLVDAYIKTPTGQGTLCEALGVNNCEEVVIGQVDVFPSADAVLYSGTVAFRLDLVRT